MSLSEDVVDTGGGLNEDGQSYYFTNDELLSEEEITDNQRCNGQVSQKFGCALFVVETMIEPALLQFRLDNATGSYAAASPTGKVKDWPFAAGNVFSTAPYT